MRHRRAEVGVMPGPYYKALLAISAIAAIYYVLDF
jgi:hypothetical protein